MNLSYRKEGQLESKGSDCPVFVRRTGMTKPPVQLGVGKNTLV